MIKVNAEGVVVDQEYFWLPMSTCPLHRKVQLLHVGGLPGYGHWNGKDKDYVGWAPAPKRLAWMKA